METKKDKETESNVDTEAHETDSSSEMPPEVAEIKPKDEAEELRKQMLYMRAEFENSRKRLLKEQEQSLKFANERIIRELLGVVDLFDRGLGFAAELKEKGSNVAGLGNFVNGIELTHRELIQLLNRFGVELTGQAGEKFDPEKHEAISLQDVDEDSKVGTVLHVAQRGCFLNGRLLTPAKVIVGKK